MPAQIRKPALLEVLLRHTRPLIHLLGDRQTQANQSGADRLDRVQPFGKDLAAIFAHELAAPTGALNALADVLSQAELSPDTQQEVLASMKGEIRLLRVLLGDLERSAGLGSQIFPVTLQHVDVGDALHRAALYASTLNRDARVTVQCEQSLSVIADPHRLEQVLHNLVSNAVEHTPPGTPIILRARLEDDDVRFDVSDFGPGIPSDLLPQIFERYVRVPPSGGQIGHGMGLGLFISHRIIEAHGSTLLVVSSEETGTTFSFRLRSTA